MSAVDVRRTATSNRVNRDGETFPIRDVAPLLRDFAPLASDFARLAGDDEEVLVIHAAHDARALHAAIAGRRVTATVRPHGHDDHTDAAPGLSVPGAPGPDTTLAAERPNVPVP